MNTDEPVYEVLQIPLSDLLHDPFQPRRTFREEPLRELAASIRQHGVLQPLLIRPLLGSEKPGKYCIVAGERRYRAAQLAGLDTVPCHVCPTLTPRATVMSLVENLQHPEMNDLEKAETLYRIKSLTGQTWDQVAELVNLSPDYVRRLAGLLKLEESVKEWVRAGKISTRVAIALRPLPGRIQIEVAERAIQEGLTAEQIRAEMHARSKPDSRVTTRVVSAPRISPPQRGTPTTPAPGDAVLKRLQDLSVSVQSTASWIADSGIELALVSQHHWEALLELQNQVDALRQLFEAATASTREAAALPQVTELSRLTALN